MQVEPVEVQRRGTFTLLNCFFFFFLPKRQPVWQPQRRVFVSTTSGFMTRPHPSGKASPPVTTPLIVQGWQPFYGSDKRQRLQSNETWSESENLWHQYLKCTQYQSQTAPHFCLLPLSVWCSFLSLFFLFLFRLPVRQMLCRRTSPRG